MNLQMNADLAKGYNSSTQRIRVITEGWVGENLYCPYCGEQRLDHFKNNRPVADFFCPKCREEFELKSKSGIIQNTISDGAYSTMISRIMAENNPNFFFMNYKKNDLTVRDFIMVPKHFFVPEIIVKRRALAETARRAGWVGCNIAVRKIPDEGKIYLIRDGRFISKETVQDKVKRINFFANYKLDARGWIFDIFNCLGKIPQREFVLSDIYRFEEELQLKHPQNHHIRAKIRQQLQLLRNKGFLEFKGDGHYRKVYYT